MINLAKCILLSVFTSFFAISAKGQMNGALFMLEDNFYAQMQNPSFMRQNKSVIVAAPGLAGFSFRNEANFKLTDLVFTRSSGVMEWDFEQFRNKGDSEKIISQWVNIPWFYIAYPFRRGNINIFYKEQLQSVALFPAEAIAFFENGNAPETFRDYNSGNMNLSLLGTHQFGLGYTTAMNENVTIGIRGILLFGAAYVEAKNWNFGIQTSENGDQVNISSNGTGRMAIKFPIGMVDGDQLNLIKFEKYFQNYIANFSNAGLGVDAGITVRMKKNSAVTISLNDFGFILFQNFAKRIYLDGTYLFRGMDITDVIDSREEGEYQKPYDLMLSTKDSIRNVYRPYFSNTGFLSGISPKLFIQYRYNYSNGFSVALANQTIFQKNYWMHTFSLNALKNYDHLSFVGNFSFFNFKTVSLGAGIQWTNRYSQLFMVTDNLLALYHPASQKTFSLTLGMNLLLNQDLGRYKKNNFNRNGKISPLRPFYRKYQ